jgi:hypothetical protein
MDAGDRLGRGALDGFHRLKAAEDFYVNFWEWADRFRKATHQEATPYRDEAAAREDAAESPWSAGFNGARGQYLCTVKLSVDGTCVWLDLSPIDPDWRVQR